VAEAWVDFPVDMQVGRQGNGPVDHRLRARHDAGAPAEPGQPMAQPGVGPFEGDGLVLASIMPARRQALFVDDVLVGADQPDVPAAQPAQQALEGRLIARPAFPIDQPAAGPVERRPDPQLVRLGAEIMPHLVHVDDDGPFGGRFRTAGLDIPGHPADHRVSAGRQ